MIKGMMHTISMGMLISLIVFTKSDALVNVTLIDGALTINGQDVKKPQGIVRGLGDFLFSAVGGFAVSCCVANQKIDGFYAGSAFGSAIFDVVSGDASKKSTLTKIVSGIGILCGCALLSKKVSKTCNITTVVKDPTALGSRLGGIVVPAWYGDRTESIINIGSACGEQAGLHAGIHIPFQKKKYGMRNQTMGKAIGAHLGGALTAHVLKEPSLRDQYIKIAGIDTATIPIVYGGIHCCVKPLMTPFLPDENLVQELKNTQFNKSLEEIAGMSVDNLYKVVPNAVISAVFSELISRYLYSKIA
jgi:hypothetical protein